jgi:hypothetical protein
MLYNLRLPVPTAAAVRKAGVWIVPADENGFLTRPFVFGSERDPLRPVSPEFPRA